MNRTSTPTNFFERSFLENGRDRWIEAVSTITGASPNQIRPYAEQAFRLLCDNGWRRFHYPLSVMSYPGGPTLASALEGEGYPAVPKTPVHVHTRELENGNWALVLNRTTIGVVPFSDLPWVRALSPFGLRFRLVDSSRPVDGPAPGAKTDSQDQDGVSRSSARLFAFNAGPAAERYLRCHSEV